MSESVESATSDATPLSPDEVILPEALLGYSTAALGKWHLGFEDDHARLAGFDHHAGSLHNLDRIGDEEANYYKWSKVIDGKLIEQPVLREMHRILAIAKRVGSPRPS